MFSVTNDRGFIPQSEQFEGRDMVGEDIKAYKIGMLVNQSKTT